MYDSEIHHRQSIRLRDYDYSTAGYYFVTVCVQRKEPLLGEIGDGAMLLNDAGRMFAYVGWKLSQRYPNVALDEYVVMPNHFHGILVVGGRGESCIRPPLVGCSAKGDHKDRPYGTTDGSVGRIIQAFKSLSTNRYIHGVKKNNWPPFPGKFWQRNYYERIIRTETELNNIRQYIRDNPCKWTDDPENSINPQP